MPFSIQKTRISGTNYVICAKSQNIISCSSAVGLHVYPVLVWVRTRIRNKFTALDVNDFISQMVINNMQKSLL